MFGHAAASEQDEEQPFSERCLGLEMVKSSPKVNEGLSSESDTIRAQRTSSAKTLPPVPASFVHEHRQGTLYYRRQLSRTSRKATMERKG